MILTSLVLLPAMALAQARTSTEPQSPSSATLQAELTHPAGMAEAAMAAAVVPAAAPASIASVSLPTHAAYREIVQTRVTEGMVDTALRQGGTMEFAMMGSVPVESSAPQVRRAVEVDLSDRELAAQPAVSNVVVHATVDAYGFPRNVTIVRSAGAMVDKKVLGAIGQYRFTPATLDNKPIDTAVTITIKIEKPQE
jgi:hypothetical protein